MWIRFNEDYRLRTLVIKTQKIHSTFITPVKTTRQMSNTVVPSQCLFIETMSSVAVTRVLITITLAASNLRLPQNVHLQAL